MEIFFTAVVFAALAIGIALGRKQAQYQDGWNAGYRHGREDGIDEMERRAND